MECKVIQLLIFLLALTIFLSTIQPVQAVTVNSPNLSGIQIFPKDNIWNTRVDNLPVDANSSIYITHLKKDTEAYTGLRTYIRNAIPYNVVNSTQRHQYLKSIIYLYYSDNVPFPIPANPLFEQGCDDHHMEIIDVDEMVLYELSAAQQNADGSWSAGMAAVWDLKGNSFRKNNETPMWATNEAGVPKFPGLVRYDEVSAGYINHSLALGIPAMQNTWVWPARSTVGVADPEHIPAGQRLRLKASFDISRFPPQTKVILQAFKTYGAMVHTNNGGNSVGIPGSPDTRWNFTDLNSLNGVDILNFEAVDVSSLMIDENSAQARQIPDGSVSLITVTSPNGGETWQRGTPHTVTWSYMGSPGSMVKIVLVKGGVEVGTIKDSTSTGSGGKGSYAWPISPTGTTGSDYKVSVQSISQPTIKDTSNNYFTLTPATTTPSITVTAPNGGESWKRGTSHTVSWSYTGSPGSTVKIVLVKGGVEVGTIKDSTSIGSGGIGSYTWPISPTGTTGSDYKVSVQSITQPTVKDVSNTYFTLTPASATSSITVTSPNGGETWKRGTSHTVNWSYTGSPGSTVKITLLKAGVEVGTINASTSIGSNGKGSYPWKMSTSGLLGSDFKVKVKSVSQPSVNDTSNNYFTIII